MTRIFRFIGLFSISCLVLACAETSPPPGDVGVPCEAGAERTCTNNVHRACIKGKWVEEDCGTLSCFVDHGCRSCSPGTGYCDGQDTFQCADDGSSATKTGTCKPEEECVAGNCIDLCTTADQKRSNVGCHFWAVDLPNEYSCVSIDGGATCGFLYGCAACQQFAVAVTNTSTYPVNVLVEINEAAPGEPIKLKKVEEKVVPKFGVGLFLLPMREVDCTIWEKDTTGRLRRKNDSQSCLSSKAYRITSSYPVVVYQFNPLVNDFSNGASLLIPRNGLDKDYLVLGWSTTNPISLPIPGQAIEGTPDYTNVTIIGTEEDTDVEVTPTHMIQASADGKIPAAKAGETFTVKIGPFDVLNINSLQDFGNITGDLTGTRVRASKKVAVFSGAQRASVPVSLDSYTPKPNWPYDPKSTCCTEHFEQQMFPISALGKRFAISRTPVRAKSGAEPDFYRILATEDGTQIKTTLSNFPTFTLNTGQQANFWSDKGFTIESNKPLMIGQYAASQGYVGDWKPGSGGDPEFVVFPPVEQYRKDYVFLTPPSFTKNYVVIATPTGNSVQLDGQFVAKEFSTTCDTQALGAIDGQDYQQITCELSPAGGPHRLTATNPVGIMAYGYYNVGSYGFPGGADVREINIK